MIQKVIVFLHKYSPIPKLRQGYRDVMDEVRKCHWLSWSELVQYTFLVVVMLVVLSFFVGVADLGLRAMVLELFKLPGWFKS